MIFGKSSDLLLRRIRLHFKTGTCFSFDADMSILSTRLFQVDVVIPSPKAF